MLTWWVFCGGAPRGKQNILAQAAGLDMAFIIFKGMAHDKGERVLNCVRFIPFKAIYHIVSRPFATMGIGIYQ